MDTIRTVYVDSQFAAENNGKYTYDLGGGIAVPEGARQTPATQDAPARQSSWLAHPRPTCSRLACTRALKKCGVGTLRVSTPSVKRMMMLSRQWA